MAESVDESPESSLHFLAPDGLPVARVPPSSGGACAVVDGRPVVPEFALREWTPYRLTVPGANALHIGSVVQPPLVEGTGVFAVIFQNQLGLARIQPLRDGKPFGRGTFVEVIAQKFATPQESTQFTDALLGDLFARQAPLPFAVAAPTGLLVREARRPPNLLFAWHFFRRHAHDLHQALQTIAHDPLRRLSDLRVDVPVDQASDVDLDTMLSVLQRATRSPNEAASSTIAGRLRPDRVVQRRPIETLDIPENRFVLDVALRFAASLDDVLRWLGMRSEVVPQIECTRLLALRKALQTFVRDRQFVDVGAMTRIPVESQVLQRRDGYRELTRLWFAFLHARQPRFDRLQHAIDIRDIATLYEYWVFFELVEQIGLALDVDGVFDPVRGDGLARALRCRFGRLGTLHYNATSRGYSGVQLRPDYLWEPADGPAVAFDAKFRMTTLSAVVGDDSPATSYAAKDDDLVKMHAYRDALPVRAAIVLYPGTIAGFHPADDSPMTALSVAGIVRNASMQGVGTIGMRPSTVGETP